MSRIRVEPADRANVIEVSDGRLILIAPIRIKRRGSRKQVTLPGGKLMRPSPLDLTPTPIQQALARGHQWLGLLERGEVSSLKEIGRRDKVDDSYVSRMINLTTLAPDIVVAILDDTLADHVTLFDLAIDPPASWDEQGLRLGIEHRPTSCQAIDF